MSSQVCLGHPSTEDVSIAMKSILTKGRKPENLHTDQGKEFYNAKF